MSVRDVLSVPLELDDSPLPSCLEDSDSTEPRHGGGSGMGSNLTASKRERVVVVDPTTQAVETERRRCLEWFTCARERQSHKDSVH